MTREEQLYANYQHSKQVLEEQEDDIRRFERRGQQIMEDSYNQLRQAIIVLTGESDISDETRHEYNQIETDYLTELHNERKQLIQQQDDLEDEYIKQKRTLLED